MGGASTVEDCESGVKERIETITTSEDGHTGWQSQEVLIGVREPDKTCGTRNAAITGYEYAGVAMQTRDLSQKKRIMK